MTPFLKEVAQDVIERYAGDYSQLCVVFPNKRAGLFFRKYFAEVAGKTVWAPDVYSIESLVQLLSGITITDKLSLVFDLFECMNNKNSEYSDDLRARVEYFDKFFHLGEILLSDFDDIDHSLADPRQVFTNIKDLSEIDLVFDYLTPEQRDIIRSFWRSFVNEHESVEKRRFIEVWERMPDVYNRFTTMLIQQRAAYEGLVYRYISEQIDKGTFRTGYYTQFVFAGFNAFTPAQQKFFDYFYKTGNAQFYWDADLYYIADNKQEAGWFLRNHLVRYAPPKQKPDIPSNFRNLSKKIQLLGIPLNVGQTKALEYCMQQISPDGNINNLVPESTAVVIADENLLFPLLHAIPPSIEKINVTMGYPARQTNLYTLIESFMGLQRKRRRDGSYYFRDVTAILLNPDVRAYDAQLADSIVRKITADNVLYVPLEMLQNYNPLYDLLFAQLPQGANILTAVMNILFLLFSRETTRPQAQRNAMQMEYIYHLYVQTKRLREIIQRKTNHRTDVVTTDIIARLLRQMLSSMNIPFSGEPLEGLQVMGLLETRNLDFENVIIIAMNEGIYPRSSDQPSFIAENLRYAFGLSTSKHKDAISAYNFYRLLQRAKRIVITYNNAGGGGGSSEMSRYVQQLVYESGLNIETRHLRQDIAPFAPPVINVQKTPAVMEKLAEYLRGDNEKSKRTLSASAINNYIDCRLQFYLKFVAELYEPQDVTEDISAPEFGTLLHDAVAKLYSDFTALKKRRNIEKSDFDELVSLVERYVDMAFDAFFAKGGQMKNFRYEGNQLIIKQVIMRYLHIILEHDKKTAPFEVVSLENTQEHRAGIEIETNNGKKIVGLKGIIDRVDKIGNTYRVIDYKTGHADKEFDGFEQLFDRNERDRKRAIVQTFYYSLIFKQTAHRQDLKIMPGVYNIRQMQAPDFSPALILKEKKQLTEINGNNFDGYLQQYIEHLQKTLQEMFDTTTAFDQTDNPNHCKYCPYNRICMR